MRSHSHTSPPPLALPEKSHSSRIRWVFRWRQAGFLCFHLLCLPLPMHQASWLLTCLVTPMLSMQIWNKTGDAKVPLCVSSPQLSSHQRRQSQPPFSHTSGPLQSILWRQRMGPGRDAQSMRAWGKWWQMKSKVTRCMDMASTYRFMSLTRWSWFWGFQEAVSLNSPRRQRECYFYCLWHWILLEQESVASSKNICSFSRSQREIHFLLRGMDRAPRRFGSKWDFSFLPTKTSTCSSSRAFTFQPQYHFILSFQRLGPAKVTPDSALLFNKKGAQCKEQARKERGEGGRARGGRGEGGKGEGKQGLWSFSCFPLRLLRFTLPMHFWDAN